MNRPPKRLVLAKDIVVGVVDIPNSMPYPAKIIYQRLRTMFKQRKIVGIGIAVKRMSGKMVGEVGLTFFVKKKLKPTSLDSDREIPPVIPDVNGRVIHTDLRAVGGFTTESGMADIRTGSAIQSEQGTLGTLGAIVRRQGLSYLLSAKHVLTAFGTEHVGANIYDVSNDHALGAANRLGRLDSFLPYSNPLEVQLNSDAALATIDPQHLARIEKSLPHAKLPFRFRQPYRGMEVQIVGAVSGDVTGIVETYPFDALTDYRSLGYLHYAGLAASSCYSQGGDSGALVTAVKTGHIVGLHLGGSKAQNLSWFVPINIVINELNIRF